jgi:hypothetical protein
MSLRRIQRKIPQSSRFFAHFPSFEQLSNSKSEPRWVFKEPTKNDEASLRDYCSSLPGDNLIWVFPLGTDFSFQNLKEVKELTIP